MEKLLSLLSELEKYIPEHEKINKRISQSSVGWHIEHTLLTVTEIINALEVSNPKQYRWSFNPVRALVSITNQIPRGRAESPDIVRPKSVPTEESLINHLGSAKQRIELLSRLKPNNYFEHPYLGKLNLKVAIRFLKIHTNHHLKIIKDIVTE